jgi:hypothetical protein
MPGPAESVTPASLTTFGDLLKHLRRRARLTQRAVAIEVGYSEVYISRLESNQRAPDSSLRRRHYACSRCWRCSANRSISTI